MKMNATRDELEAHSIYQPRDIHPAHINQIGEAVENASYIVATGRNW